MNRQDLYDYKDNKEWLDKRKDKIIEDYEGIQKLASTYGQNTKGSSPIQDRLAENLITLLDMKKETLAFAIVLEKDLQNIENDLLKIKQPERNLLTFLYINGMKPIEVANEMKYSYSQYKKLKKIALKLWDNL